jgi:small subunit ribosomal protein S1
LEKNLSSIFILRKEYTMETTPQAPIQASQNETQLTPPSIGDVVVGTVTKLIREIAFVDIGQEQEGYINLSEFRNDQGEVDLNLGDQIEAKVVSVRSGIRLSRGQIEDPQSVEEVRQAYLNQLPVDGTVVKVNKGGYELRIKQLRAFCPISQFALHYEKNPRRRLGATLPFLITEMTESDKGLNIVASRRPILEEEQNRRIQLMSTRFNIDDIIKGRVTQLTKFGAFVDVGDGIEGLIPMSELAHNRIEKASDVVSARQEIDVKVIAVEPERNRLTLSLRQLVKDAWEVFVDENPVGS